MRKNEMYNFERKILILNLFLFFIFPISFRGCYDNKKKLNVINLFVFSIESNLDIIRFLCKIFFINIFIIFSFIIFNELSIIIIFCLVITV